MENEALYMHYLICSSQLPSEVCISRHFTELEPRFGEDK